MGRVCFILLLIVDLFACPLVCSGGLTQQNYAHAEMKSGCKCCGRCRSKSSDQPTLPETPRESGCQCVCAGCILPPAADSLVHLGSDSPHPLFAFDAAPIACVAMQSPSGVRLAPEPSPSATGRSLRIQLHSFLC